MLVLVCEFGVTLRGSHIAFGASDDAGNTATLFSQTAVDDGAWHHVAVTRDSWSGFMELYVDGELESTGSGPAGVMDATPILRLGALQMLQQSRLW